MMPKGKKKRYWYQGSPFLVSWFTILFLMFLYSFTRLALWIFSPSLFPYEGFTSSVQIVLGGCRFDLSALLMVNLPYFFLINLPFPWMQKKWPRFIAGLLFFTGNFLAFAANLADSVYFRFTQKRMTGDFFNYMKAGGDDLINLLPQYMKDFWYIFVILLGLTVLLILFKKKIRVEIPKKKTRTVFLRDILLFVLMMAFCVVGIRGGFQLKPIHLMSAGQFAQPSYVPLVLNTPFSIIKTWNQNEITQVRYFSDGQQLEKLYNPVHQASFKPFQPMNVVVIIMESFSSEFSSFLNTRSSDEHSKGYMPFLDSLMQQSLVFNGFANGKRSIEGIPAIVASLPSWMNNDYITSSFAGNKINSLPNLLKEKGYHSSFFHGGNNGTMNFDAFARIAGFDRYYGRSEYANDKDFDGKWGIFDEPFFQYFAKELNKTPAPFVSVIFSLSSHHPYTIPQRYTGRFPKGRLPIHEAIGYADYSLKRFFQTASQMPWFNNTLFVITADHTAEADLPYYKTRVGTYSIPIVFFRQGSSLQGMDERIVQQLDIMPTVLDVVGYDLPYIGFGGSVFDKTWPRFALSYLNSSYLLIRDRYAMVYSGEGLNGLYDLNKDHMQKINLVGKNDPSVIPLTNFLKAVIQQYNNRVSKNQLTVTE
ncbi:MAG: sulfatase-like hydrolase/transferase [Bacteroidetes bacterium]|nr:sulfatase-like hydrolase/transferase [Bacteroidota bacterium]